MDHWLFVRIGYSWPFFRAFGRGQPTGFDRLIEAGARRLLDVAAAGDADEIILIGHSGGGALAPCVMARALQLDPALGRSGPPVLLLTIGSIMPGVALHPRATRMREAVRQVAVAPNVTWIECQARKDAMNFYDFDPVAGIGVDAGAARCNPTLWPIRFRDMISEKVYRTLRIKFFRLHYQFVMANNIRAPYDFYMVTFGPLPVMDWVRRGRDAIADFGADGRLSG